MSPAVGGGKAFLRCLNFLEEPTAGVVDIAGWSSG
jgi:ABC-type histidine transport system ATPase subunit